MTITKKKVKPIKPIISSKFRLGDNVIVTTGKDKTKTGDIVAIDRIKGKIKVKGVNLVTKFTKNSIDTKERFINISNVQHIDANGKPSRVGFRIEDNKKVRFFKSTNATLSVIMDYNKAKNTTEVTK